MSPSFQSVIIWRRNMGCYIHSRTLPLQGSMRGIGRVGSSGRRRWLKQGGALGFVFLGIVGSKGYIIWFLMLLITTNNWSNMKWYSQFYFKSSFPNFILFQWKKATQKRSWYSCMMWPLAEVPNLKRSETKLNGQAEGQGFAPLLSSPSSASLDTKCDMWPTNGLMLLFIDAYIKEVIILNLIVIFYFQGQGGHRTLLYGHAILLRHALSDMVRYDLKF